MRVGIVHDWLRGMRGGEKVLSCLCELLGEADILTLLHVPGSCDKQIESRRIITSGLNDLPGVRRYYRYLLGVMPLAIERLKAMDYDLIISSSHCVAKGIIKRAGALHVCYCHTPMRYAWGQEKAYGEKLGWALKAMGRYLRAWDVRSSKHVDYFLANSRNVAGRIWQSYQRRAEVIYPPIDTEFFTPGEEATEDFYLMVTAMSPYKKVGQAIEAFAKLGRRLQIIGSGQQLAKLRGNAPKNIEFLGWQSDVVVRDRYRKCRALIFPGEEDFGMVPAEAMACGSPVIAYGAGGVLESIVNAGEDQPSGLLYTPQTVETLISAVREFEKIESKFEPNVIAAKTQRFGKARFLEHFREFLGPLLERNRLTVPW